MTERVFMDFSRIMLGTVQFGLPYGINNHHGKPSLDQVEKILRAAADGGINVLDTARNYEESEEVLGIVLTRSGLDKHFKIISKVKIFPDNLPPDDVQNWMRNSVETSLKMLKRDTLDGLLMHNEKDLAYCGLMKTMAEDLDWAPATGSSLESVQGSPMEFIQSLDMAQIPCNILDRRFIAGAQAIKARGGKVFARSVYLQGLLLKPAEEMDPKFAPVMSVRRQLEQLSCEAGMMPAELYFRYMLSLPEIDCVLTGVDTVEQLQENIRLASHGALSSDIIEEIRRIVPDLPENYLRPGLWQSL